MTLEMFVVVNREGRVRRTRSGTLCAYSTSAAARRVASARGDTVTVASIDLERQPLFIRGSVVIPDAP